MPVGFIIFSFRVDPERSLRRKELCCGSGRATVGRSTEVPDDAGVGRSMDSSGRHRVVTEYALEVGDVPGGVPFMEVDSPDEASGM
jgi:hypothetical protein